MGRVSYPFIEQIFIVLSYIYIPLVNLLEEQIRQDSTAKKKKEKEVLYADDVWMTDEDEKVESEMDQPYIMEIDETSASEDEDEEDEPEAQ